jgi:hypothetical protein
MKSAERQKLLVAGAKKEGKVTFYTGLIVDQVVRPLKEGFEKEYPFVQVDFFRGNSENIAKGARRISGQTMTLTWQRQLRAATGKFCSDLFLIWPSIPPS